MTWTNKVTWSEGLFLRPQLFQQQERYLESFVHKRAAPLSPFYWGFSQFRIDTESLTLGKLVLDSAAGVCADGTPFDMPSLTPPPPPLTLLPEHLQQVIYLALPIRTPNGEETTYHDKQGKQTHIGRFIGWMGFDDAPRPVIGKHGDYWLCLHECPDGEKPGVIEDIVQWTGKRGWPIPKPTPYFPDSQLKTNKGELND